MESQESEGKYYMHSLTYIHSLTFRLGFVNIARPGRKINKSQCNLQTYSTHCVLDPGLCLSLLRCITPHRRSTTVSLETYHFIHLLRGL